MKKKYIFFAEMFPYMETFLYLCSAFRLDRIMNQRSVYRLILSSCGSKRDSRKAAGLTTLSTLKLNNNGIYQTNGSN